MTFMGEKNVFEQEITVDNAMGLHARPAAQLVRIASGYDASMSVEKLDDDGEVADFQLGGVAQHCRSQSAGIDLQHGEVALFI